MAARDTFCRGLHGYILTRVALHSARPRDLTRLLSSIAVLPQIKSTLKPSDHKHIKQLLEKAKPLPHLVELLDRAIIENPPMVIREGGVIADGYDSELDELRALNSNAGEFLLAMEEREKQATGIANLKVHSRLHVGLNIQLYDSKFSLFFFGKIFHQWRDCAARCAPSGPKVNQHGKV